MKADTAKFVCRTFSIEPLLMLMTLSITGHAGRAIHVRGRQWDTGKERFDLAMHATSVCSRNGVSCRVKAPCALPEKSNEGRCEFSCCRQIALTLRSVIG